MRWERGGFGSLVWRWGVLIKFLCAARHELGQATVFRTQVMNEWFGRAIGFIEIFPCDHAQIMHFAHHQNTQNRERDGELLGQPQMLTKPAHQVFLAVPFWKLGGLNGRIGARAGRLHRMGWIEFQIGVIGKLTTKDESRYPMIKVWVVPASGGRTRRVAAE